MKRYFLCQKMGKKIDFCRISGYNKNIKGEHMKKFFQDFKKFISRGNIIDMAIGVIVGTAFSAIVTALTNKIIMPFINYLLSLGGAGLSSAFTFLKKVYAADGTIDLANSIYIDWGAFITAIINFLIIAFTLFIILKVAMKSSELFKEARSAVKPKLTKEDRKILKGRGVSLKNKQAIKDYLAEKEAAAEKAKADEELKKKAEEEEKYKNSTEGLLKEIRDLLANKQDASVQIQQTTSEKAENQN